MKVIADRADFDSKSGTLLERLIFNNRLLILLFCLLTTLILGYQLRNLEVTASYDKMLPQNHGFITNFLDNRAQLRGLGDSVRVVVENPNGDIFNKEFLATLARINDEIFLLPGVDRAWMKSIFTPVVRWTEVTEEGFNGGPVLPNTYNGSDDSIAELRMNIARAGVVGSLVSNDYRSSMIAVPLLPVDASGQPLDYHALATAVEQVRQKYEAGLPDTAPVRVYVVGFAKLIGDLIDAVVKVMYFFAAAAMVATAIIFWYTRCVRSTFLLISCSLIGVVWQLGILVWFGRGLDPFSILVPFLVFAIGVSHGAQKMNGIMLDVGNGTDYLVAARYTFRRLFLAGIVALAADAFGFALLVFIDIPVIRELAVAAAVGMATLVITNLILLPILLSYTGVSMKAAKYAVAASDDERAGVGFGRLWGFLGNFTSRNWAIGAIVIGVVLLGVGYAGSTRLQVGDLDSGAPELRPDSRYNMDNSYVTSHYGISSDVFVVMVKTPPDQCRSYDTLVEVDRLGWVLAQVPGVQMVSSLADTVRSYTMGGFEGNPKWMTISESQTLVDAQINNALTWNSEYLDADCALLPVVAFLQDHKADTLSRVTAAAQAFADEHNTDNRKFLLAAGNSGVDAATNIVVRKSNELIFYLVYGVVIVLCLITFRSWRAVVVTIVPLIITSLLAEALMVFLGIGLKVATLPVVALGVGIGVDYALYLLSVQLAQQRAGMSLAESYRRTVAFTGKVVGLVGVTLAASVVTWVWSPIKFQADMGILLTFMFLWNMIGALILIPALSHFLLRDVKRA